MNSVRLLKRWHMSRKKDIKGAPIFRLPNELLDQIFGYIHPEEVMTWYGDSTLPYWDVNAFALLSTCQRFRKVTARILERKTWRLHAVETRSFPKGVMQNLKQFKHFRLVTYELYGRVYNHDASVKPRGFFPSYTILFPHFCGVGILESVQIGILLQYTSSNSIWSCDNWAPYVYEPLVPAIAALRIAAKTTSLQNAKIIVGVGHILRFPEPLILHIVRRYIVPSVVDAISVNHNLPSKVVFLEADERFRSMVEERLECRNGYSRDGVTINWVDPLLEMWIQDERWVGLVLHTARRSLRRMEKMMHNMFRR